jgi:mannose-6-phosphate isomerase
MTVSALYPLRFAPIYQYRPWGGRHLADWLDEPLPAEGPIGEAWLLSDRDEYPSCVAEGPLKGHTIAQLMEHSAEMILGKLAPRFDRFPLLLKLLDVSGMLSVQVHPSDAAVDLIPKGDTGKTEAWVVLDAAAGSHIYAGLKPGTTRADLRTLSKQSVDEHVASFTPVRGQSVLIEAGIVHSMGNGVVVFEVQENSDVTFRLYDWDRIDPRTGLSRALQVEQALACVDFSQGEIGVAMPVADIQEPATRERLLSCSHFQVWRVESATPFPVGALNVPRILVCIDGGGQIEHAGSEFAMKRGTVMLLPAAVGPCRFRPQDSVTLLDIAVPDCP